ncbi:MAG: hypothetical protein PVG13_05630 [Thiohalophilus sp.]|jgi:hypothetical protein
MDNFWSSLIIGVIILTIAIPYVARIRHPEQKPLAAYLIFTSVFVVVAVVLFNLLVFFVAQYKLTEYLDQIGPATLFLVLMFLPAIILASWLARMPPWRQGPPP